jgi:2-aminoadipate transaminase
LHTDQLAQAILAEFVRRGHLTRHLHRMNKVYRSRLEAMEEALQKHMPPDVTWNRPEGGMTMWLKLPPGFDAGELLIHARERKIIFVPGRHFYMQQPQPNTLRLGFSTIPEKMVVKGVQALADLIRVELQKRQRGARQEAVWREALI